MLIARGVLATVAAVLLLVAPRVQAPYASSHPSSPIVANGSETNDPKGEEKQRDKSKKPRDEKRHDERNRDPDEWEWDTDEVAYA